MKPGGIRFALSTGDDSRLMLEERYAADPRRLANYKSSLLEPGWAGDLDNVEFEYLKSELMKSRRLRRQWGFRPSAKRLSESWIRTVAMYGVTRQRK
jgi:hypothetical protein